MAENPNTSFVTSPEQFALVIQPQEQGLINYYLVLKDEYVLTSQLDLHPINIKSIIIFPIKN